MELVELRNGNQVVSFEGFPSGQLKDFGNDNGYQFIYAKQKNTFYYERKAAFYLSFFVALDVY
ncbi:hypothetical protein BC792_1337 [Sphingobacterium allocomposti]|uniref:Uncharacterized protein n=1 Tax=Sphingobacterium allocomposti TaxID=415956 RepID=A0A5S5CZ09_9SPHI|nr:hypothetical protein BC792_1337 [Sphingobacterium composti Yoo et al. 2007 non Ten et al. 2007]